MKNYITLLSLLTLKLWAQEAHIIVQLDDKTFSLPYYTASQSQLLKDAYEIPHQPSEPSITILSRDLAINLPMQAITELMQAFEKHKTLSGKALLDAVEKDIGTELNIELLNASEYLDFGPGINLVARSLARSKPDIRELKKHLNDHIITVIAYYHYLIHEKDLKGIDPQTIGFSFQDYADYLPHVVQPKDNRLNLSFKRLNHISPNDLKAFSNLKGLDLSVNKLAQIPSFTGLPTLEELHLSDNQLTQIPSFKGLHDLKVLDFRNNKLTQIPSFNGLHNLKVLDFRNNKLTQIPPFSGLPNLRDLDLSSNLFTELPPFTGLPKLKELWLAKNKLTQIPHFTDLPKLKTVYLGTNKFSPETKNSLHAIYGDKVQT